ncbi:peptidoglycan DD-metalloendopeptidase family protein [Actinomadura sp. WMMA1423]|uniref:peptidoglycan DD-metalloendopeptidase family protein n=1 Tax=Actinomadura sp. WMMA1423 TaxID=2591108 RepID=UPI0011469E19|nr:peptidoglycan DD-metalloendopeptidase family protein [Actinomadura sp. WMMA1423]
MARRDYGHASRSQTHASPWAETSARPSSGPEPRRGLWSEDPQWPEGSWWSEQPDGAERGRKASRREPRPARRETKRREAKARDRRSAEGSERPRPRPRAQWPEPPERRGGGSEPFDARGGYDPAGYDARTRRDPRTERRDARTEPFDARNGGRDARAGRRDARTEAFDARTGRRDARTEAFDARTGRRDARTEAFDARTGRRDARTEAFDARTGRRDARTEAFDARNGGRDARAERRDARTERFDARTERFDARSERFDARSEGLGGPAARSGRDRSREFPPRGGRSRRTEGPRPGPRAERRPERRPARPARPEPRRRQSPPRPGPKATPRRGRRPTDRLSIGAIVLSTAVGLSLLGIAERALLDGGPVGGSSGPVGSQRAIKPPRPGTGTPAQPRQPQQQPPGTGGAAAPPASPDLGVLATQVRKLTLAQRGAAARQAYGAALTRQPFVGVTRQSADKTWVFGTSAIPVPPTSAAAPELAFYAAHWTGGRWQTALSGGTAFATLLGTAPANLMSASESRLVRKYGALSSAQATTLLNGTRAGDRLMLPWKIGQAWSMTTSDDATTSRPLASLAFSGGDGRVLAAGAGRLYRFCSSEAGAVVMVIHPSGLASTYYGMRGVTELRDGSVVEQGDTLGRTGTARPCGGAAAPRAEVGFGLRRGGGAVPLDGAAIGGWTFQERAKPLLGFAQRGVLQVLPGGLLANLGPVPAADDSPSSSPSPGKKPKKDGAGSAGVPTPAAT